MNERTQVFWGLLAVALALVIAAVAGSIALSGIRRSGDEIAVTGSARKPIRSDFIIWRGSVSAQAATMQAAFDQVTRDAGRVRAYLTEKQVPAEETTFGSVETMPLQETLADGRTTGRVTGYQLTQPFEVRSAAVDKIAALSRQITDLIREGIPLVSAPPEYISTRLSELRIEMLAEASKDARQRAETIAGSVGNRIGKVRAARMGVFQVTPRYSTDVSGAGINDTSSLEKDITAVVSVTFGLK